MILFFSKGQFDDFIQHLRGLQDIYKIPGDKYVLFHCSFAMQCGLGAVVVVLLGYKISSHAPGLSPGIFEGVYLEPPKAAYVDDEGRRPEKSRGENFPPGKFFIIGAISCPLGYIWD